jgi:putative flippase GtrA
VFIALSRQMLMYLLAGLAQLALDWALFVVLSHAGVALALANFAGRVCGAALGFWLNGRYTFSDGGRARLERRHLLRFVPAWLALTALSTLLLMLVERQFNLQAAWLAKPAVEALVAAIGFVVWRQWVFR